MDVIVSVLCDAATDDRGKLNILGAFDTIFSHTLPAIHPGCAIALRVTFHKHEEGEHHFALNFVNDDGQSVLPPMGIPINVKLPNDSAFVSKNFIINIQQLKFDTQGDFSVDVLFDNDHVASIPLMVRQIHEPEGEQPSGS